MAKRKKSGSDKPRHWPSALVFAAEKNPPTITSWELAEELDLEAPSACQVLRRLQSWGLLRLAGFKTPEGGIGRRQKVYELTTAGEKKVKRILARSRR